VKPLVQLTEAEIAKVAAMPVRERCARIVVAFDEWLSVHVLRYGLKHDDLPQLNDAFRDYFAGARSERCP
jgi:hypothetical protein